MLDSWGGLSDDFFFLDPGPQSPAVDGGFTEWSDWSACSKTCGIGEKARERTCNNPKPQGKGSKCIGDKEEKMNCKVMNCSIGRIPMICLK